MVGIVAPVSGTLSDRIGIRPLTLLGLVIMAVTYFGFLTLDLDMTTAHYLAERLEGFPLRITQLAHGLPVGGELDYLDEGTLAQALRARRPVG